VRLTEKLLRYIYSAMNKAPESLVAFRARSQTGILRFTIKDYVLTCTVDKVKILEQNLFEVTIDQLIEKLKSLGLTIPYMESWEIRRLSATTLLDAESGQDKSNGDCFYVYTSLLWAYLEAVSVELASAKRAIVEMLEQMSIRGARDFWLDYWGKDHFGVPREDEETDEDYAVRIIVEILRPRGNNKAIDLILVETFGLDFDTVDYPDQHPTKGTRYGLFDININYDLEKTQSVAELGDREFEEKLLRLIESFRDAGTHLRALRFFITTYAYPKVGSVNISGESTRLYPFLIEEIESVSQIRVGSVAFSSEETAIYPMEEPPVPMLTIPIGMLGRASAIYLRATG
jgi:P2-related tail formation protein